jgi:uncharacterized membrane protein HdeD (DUF308 family)
MSAQQFFLKALTLSSRILGVIWILGGIAFSVSAFVNAEYRVLHAAIGAVVLLAGVGLLLAKPAKSDDVEKVKLFAKRIGRG